MSRYSRRDQSSNEGQLGMTPMIDVVFLLLVFFIVTMEPLDIMAKLVVDRPAPSDEPGPPPALTLSVTEGGYLLNNKRVSLEYIDHYLGSMSTKFGMDELLIICYDKSQHSGLVRALDICTKNKITNISLSSR